MARRRLGVPHVIAYWWKSPSIARCAASSSSGGGEKFGIPWARLTPPSWLTTRVISRMTDSVFDPPPAARERLFARLHLQRDPAVVRLHVGAADVDDDVEVLHQPIE